MTEHLTNPDPSVGELELRLHPLQYQVFHSPKRYRVLAKIFHALFLVADRNRTNAVHSEPTASQNETPDVNYKPHPTVCGTKSMAVRLLLHPGMDDVISNILMGETVVHKNPLATVTRNCLIVRDQFRGAQAIISFQSIRKMKKVNTTNISLLAIASGFFTIAAAAYSSHEGYEVTTGIGLIGLLFVFGYFSTRRAAILFLLDDQSIETTRGSYREATSIIRAVERMSSDT